MLEVRSRIEKPTENQILIQYNILSEKYNWNFSPRELLPAHAAYFPNPATLQAGTIPARAVIFFICLILCTYGKETITNNSILFSKKIVIHK